MGQHLNKTTLKIPIRNGVAYFYSRTAILKEKKVLPNNSLHYEIKGNYINIDDHNDLNLARKLI